MKKISDYRNSELVELSNDAFTDAVRIEALHRKIDIPISVPENLRMSEWTGFQRPSEAVKVFRIKIGYQTSEFAYLSEEKAIAALEGMVKVECRTWEHLKLLTLEQPEICIDWIGVFPNASKMEKFDKGSADYAAFDKLIENCTSLVVKLKSSVWQLRMLAEKKAEYLRLADGDSTVAKSFWAGTVNSPWFDLDPTVDDLSVDWENFEVLAVN